MTYVLLGAILLLAIGGLWLSWRHIDVCWERAHDREVMVLRWNALRELAARFRYLHQGKDPQDRLDALLDTLDRQLTYMGTEVGVRIYEPAEHPDGVGTTKEGTWC